MTRRTTKAEEPAHRADPEPDTLDAEAAEAEAKPEQNEGNESAMAGRVNPDA